MSAEGLLDNPALFYPNITYNKDSGDRKISVDKLKLALEYLDLATNYPVKMKSVIFHIRRICKEEFDKYQVTVIVTLSLSSYSFKNK
jgi:hypothetical protein